MRLNLNILCWMHVKYTNLCYLLFFLIEQQKKKNSYWELYANIISKKNVLIRFRLWRLAIAYTLCCSRGSVMWSIESLLISRENGSAFIWFFLLQFSCAYFVWSLYVHFVKVYYTKMGSRSGNLFSAWC